MYCCATHHGKLGFQTWGSSPISLPRHMLTTPLGKIGHHPLVTFRGGVLGKLGLRNRFHLSLGLPSQKMRIRCRMVSLAPQLRFRRAASACHCNALRVPRAGVNIWLTILSDPRANKLWAFKFKSFGPSSFGPSNFKPTILSDPRPGQILSDPRANQIYWRLQVLPAPKRQRRFIFPHG